ncbi:hypothetical protein LINPERHAP1_LOCUS6719, partial [Linum perenne]
MYYYPDRKWRKCLWIQKGHDKAIAVFLLMVYGVCVSEFINNSVVSRYLMLLFCLYVFSIALATKFPAGFDATRLWLGSTMIMVWATDCGSCGGKRHYIQATIVTVVIALLVSLREYLECYEDETVAGPNDQPPDQNDQGATGSGSGQNNEDEVAVTTLQASSHAPDHTDIFIPDIKNASS